jgi:indolepyruvate ferredoxin oxidoreductase, beta subunit
MFRTKLRGSSPARIVNSMDLAVQAGNMRKTVNTVLLGALSNMIDIDQDMWLRP